MLFRSKQRTNSLMFIEKYVNVFICLPFISLDFVLCLALFRRLNSIAEINDDKETWKIDVRLINMWIIPRLPRFNIKQIFIDKEVRLLDLFNMVYPLVVVSFFLKHVYKI